MFEGVYIYYEGSCLRFIDLIATLNKFFFIIATLALLVLSGAEGSGVDLGGEKAIQVMRSILWVRFH
jgi:hypothetical protein